MGYPNDIGIVDLMIGFPHDREGVIVDRHRDKLKDADSQAMTKHPAEYMFKDVPAPVDEGQDPVQITLGEMDKYGIEIGLVGLTQGEVAERGLRDHPERFVASFHADPNDITTSVRAIRAAHEQFGIKAVYSFPSGAQIAIGDRRHYPIYQTCVDLGVPIILNTGIAGPRWPSAHLQDPVQLDIVCYEFPELKVVMCHGAEPWEGVAAKLMLKYPNLYYMTSAFAPKYYPKTIVDFANTRGADKVMYAGYYPAGLTLERIFRDMPEVPFKDDVWPKFLRENAIRVFGLNGSG
jgi:predicted TIM-barrel fold metal-dependent hydrolase